MSDYYQMTIEDWLASKTEEIRQEMNKAAQSFVAIGYKLREVRDSGNLSEGETITDYAKREFGLSSSTTSRFIAISEKFGDGLELKQEFVGIGSAKLQEMLTLSDADCELITRDTTVKQIREIKAFENEKHEELKAEVVEEVQFGAFEKCIIDFFKDKPELLNSIVKAEYLETEDYRKAADLLSPNGSTTHKKGIIFLFMYGFDDGIRYKVFGEREPRSMTYIAFINTIRDIYPGADTLNPHEAFYGPTKEDELQQNQAKEEIATSQVEEVTETVTQEEEVTESVSPENESHDSENENQGFENESHDSANDSQEDDNGEASNEDDNSSDREIDNPSEAPADDDVEAAESTENLTEEAEGAAVEDDPRKELQEDLKHYCKELVEASYWPVSEADRYRERSDELIDLILNARKDLLLMNFNLKNELEDED